MSLLTTDTETIQQPEKSACWLIKPTVSTSGKPMKRVSTRNSILYVSNNDINIEAKP